MKDRPKRNAGKRPAKKPTSGSRSKSSARWLQRQRKDYFVRQAQAEGQVSRAHYKLAQIDQRYSLLKPAADVLELGAAPGGWTHYIQSRAGQGTLIAVDPLPITANAQTWVVEGRVGAPEVNELIDQHVQSHTTNGKLDLVLSDMAPNMSGVRTVDQARAMDLADLALEACERWLDRGGSLAIKAFQGEGLDEWVTQLRQSFAKVVMTKPKASRTDSREVFVVAKGFQQ